MLYSQKAVYGKIYKGFIFPRCMGRIRSTLIKRTGVNLVTRYPDKFNIDFNNNKQNIPGVAEVHSKKLRNVIAGYITKLGRKKQ
jgi:small subunit ribosomal protein S17e